VGLWRTPDNRLPMLNKRKSPRRKMVLPVKVSIDSVTHLAHTIDITDVGARLGALRTQLKPGTVISLHRGAKKAKFRVEWIRELTSNELQAGIESVEPQNNFWGVDLSDRKLEAKKEMQAVLTLLSSRSKSVL
jgi:primosomal protein N'